MESQINSTKILELIESINDVGKHSRTVFLAFLALLTYVVVTVWSTTHLQLLLETPLTLPLINVKVPLIGFFSVAPWLVLLSHFNILLLLYFYSKSLHELNFLLSSLGNEALAKQYRHKLFPFHFSHLIAGVGEGRTVRILLNLYGWCTLLLLPFITLFSLQVTFISYHDIYITWGHRIVILLDVTLVSIFWTKILTKKSLIEWALILLKMTRTFVFRALQKRRQIDLRRFKTTVPLPKIHIKPLLYLLPTIFVFPFLSVFVVTIPGEKAENIIIDATPSFFLVDTTSRRFNLDKLKGDYYDGRTIDGDLLFMPTYWLFHRGPFHRNLEVSSEIVSKTEVAPELYSGLTIDSKGPRSDLISKIGRLKINNRNLTYANFKSAFLVNVDFSGSDVSYANFSDSFLQRSKFSNEKTIRGVNFSSANLFRAHIFQEDAKDFDMSYIKFERTSLAGRFSKAQFLHNEFVDALLPYTTFVNSDFHHVTFTGGLFKGSLIEANFYEASFDRVEIDWNSKLSWYKKSIFNNLSEANMNFDSDIISDTSFSNVTFSYLELIATLTDRILFKNIKIENGSIELSDLRSAKFYSDGIELDKLDSFSSSKQLIKNTNLCPESLAGCQLPESLQEFNEQLYKHYVGLDSYIPTLSVCRSAQEVNALGRRLMKTATNESFVIELTEVLLSDECLKQGNLDNRLIDKLRNKKSGFETQCFIDGNEVYKKNTKNGRQESISKSHPECDFDQGMMFFNNEDYISALRHFQQAAMLAQNNPEFEPILAAAYYNQAIISYNGLGVENNKRAAITFWEKAFVHHDVKAGSILCGIYVKDSKFQSSIKAKETCTKVKESLLDSKTYNQDSATRLEEIERILKQLKSN